MGIIGYQLKITIRGSKPPIWRRVIVPDLITFADLDMIIEEIFGWQHGHLYEFYFKDDNAHITMQPDSYDQNDSEKECIDSWFHEGAKCTYTYDFGDDWEHTVLVEKTIPYDKRYATVIKSKGPYTIEDCGGIWGFYEYIDNAPEFDIDTCNKILKTMEFEETVPMEDDDLEDDDLDDETREFFAQMENYSQDLILRKETAEALAREHLDMLSSSLSLEEVFMYYPKSDLCEIAKANGFSRYSKYKKAELAQWLANHLLDTPYMSRVFAHASQTEIDIFEDAMNEEAGIWIDMELIRDSLLLCTYGAYTQWGLYQIPKDVAAKYRQISTANFRKARERLWKVSAYSKSAVYLYGAISLNDFTDIYNSYEAGKLTAGEIAQILVDDGDLYGIGIWDNIIYDSRLVDNNLYLTIYEHQKDIPYYCSDDPDTYLQYGNLECQEPDENMEPFFGYLLAEKKLSFPRALALFYELQEHIRLNHSMRVLLDIMDVHLMEAGLNLSGKHKRKEAEQELLEMIRYTRVYLYRGHTYEEFCSMQEKTSSKGNGNVIPFPEKKKAYPNDPFPIFNFHQHS